MNKTLNVQKYHCPVFLPNESSLFFYDDKEVHSKKCLHVDCYGITIAQNIDSVVYEVKDKGYRK